MNEGQITLEIAYEIWNFNNISDFSKIFEISRFFKILQNCCGLGRFWDFQRILERFFRESVSFVGEISWTFLISMILRISYGISKKLLRFVTFQDLFRSLGFSKILMTFYKIYEIFGVIRPSNLINTFFDINNGYWSESLNADHARFVVWTWKRDPDVMFPCNNFTSWDSFHVNLVLVDDIILVFNLCWSTFLWCWIQDDFCLRERRLTTFVLQADAGIFSWVEVLSVDLNPHEVYSTGYFWSRI